MSTLADAPAAVRFDYSLLQVIMGRAVERSRRPQECLHWEPEHVVWADDHQSATFQYPGVSYMLSYRAGARGTFVFEHRGDLGFVWSQEGEVVAPSRPDPRTTPSSRRCGGPRRRVRS